MAVCAKLYSSPASVTSNEGGPSAVGSLHFGSSRNVLCGNSRPPCVGMQHAGFGSFQCSLSIVVTEKSASVLTQDNPLSYPAASENEAMELGSSKAELPIDEAEYIESLAVEIQECSQAEDLAAGEELHGCIIDAGLDSDRYLANLLVLMYGNCGSTEAAEVVFHKIPFPNIYSSNIMINVYVTNDDLKKARAFFDDMPERNAASWNAIISALAKNGYGKEALQYYSSMLAGSFQPNVITYVSTIDACADAAELSEGMKLHSTVEVHGFFDMIVGTALINMYGQCGSLESARDIHRKFPQHDVFSWSAMIAACVSNGRSKEALDMFNQMPDQGLVPTRSTFLSVLDACGNLGDLWKGYEIHAQILSGNVVSHIRVENALINMYGRCQSVEDGIIMFNRMRQRNTITWTTVIAVHSQNHKNKEAIELFYEMQMDCVNPNNFAISIVFDVCTSMEDLQEGQCVYNYSMYTGIELDCVAAIALINMYGKCCRPDDARAVFDSFDDEHEVLLWNALMSAYATNGQADEARQIFERMQFKGVKPNKASFKILEDLKVMQEPLEMSGRGLGEGLAGDQNKWAGRWGMTDI